jgi:hypothetical protein
MITNVLRPCVIPSCINIQQLQTYVKEYMEPRKQFYKETKRSLYIEDEFSEWWIEKVSSGKQIGKGNKGTDVVTSDLNGIDVMCVVMKKNLSNEKSIIQNFKSSGNNLDELFKNKNDKLAIKLYADELYNKLNSVKMQYNLVDLYILAFISLPDSIHLCSFKYDITLFENVYSNGFSNTGQSIIIKGFIEEKYGNVILYKEKSVLN